MAAPTYSLQATRLDDGSSTTGWTLASDVSVVNTTLVYDSNNWVKPGGSLSGVALISFRSETGGTYVEGRKSFTAQNMTNKLFVIQAEGTNWNRLNDWKIRFYSGGAFTDYIEFDVQDVSTSNTVSSLEHVEMYDPSAAPTATGGTFDITDVTCVAWYAVPTSNVTAFSWGVHSIDAVSRDAGIRQLAGDSGTPGTMATLSAAEDSLDQYAIDALGQSVFLLTYPFLVGDGGTTLTYFQLVDKAVEFYPSFTMLTDPERWARSIQGNGNFGITLNIGAADTCDIRNSLIAANFPWRLSLTGASGAGTKILNGSTVINASGPYIEAGFSVARTTFKRCGSIATTGAIAFTLCTVSETLAGASAAALVVDNNSASLSGTEIDLTGSSAGYHLELATSVTAIALNDVTFTGTPGVDKVHVLRTTGTVDITVSGSTSLSAGDVTTDGATINIISSPVTVSVTATTADGTPIQDARVYLITSPGASVILNGLTDVNGVISTTYSGSTPQAVTGWARKSSSAPYYAEGPLGGSITSAGYGQTAILTLDE